MGRAFNSKINTILSFYKSKTLLRSGHPSVCPSRRKLSLVLTPFPWSCGEELGKRKQLINAPENKPGKTTSHLAPGAMENAGDEPCPTASGGLPQRRSCLQPFPKPPAGAGGQSWVLTVPHGWHSPAATSKTSPGATGRGRGRGIRCAPACWSPPELPLLQLLLRAWG